MEFFWVDNALVFFLGIDVEVMLISVMLGVESERRGRWFLSGAGEDGVGKCVTLGEGEGFFLALVDSVKLLHGGFHREDGVRLV